MMSTFPRAKALAGCRAKDLCQIKSSQFDVKDGTLTIDHTQDETHRTRTIPLPRDLVSALRRIKGPEYLWESCGASVNSGRAAR